MLLMQKHEKYDWSRLNHLQVGKYAEYFVKMEYVLYGFDVYSAEVDDKGIDFVIRKGHDRYYDVQVKSSRGFNYIFFPKDKFELRDNMPAAVVFFLPNQAPDLFLISSMAWCTPNRCFVSRDYEGKKSKPEWGLSVTPTTYAMLAEYSFERIVQRL
jgi:hypothetical protein